MEKEKEMYKKPVNALMKDSLYIIRLAMLIFLQAIIAGYRLELQNNIDFAGDFNDLVIKLLSNDSTSQVFFLHAKHFETKYRKITLTELKSCDRNFSLYKYFKAYQQIKKYSKNFSNKGVNVDAAEFIIYTNIDFDDISANYFEEKTKICKELQILLSRESMAFKIKHNMVNDVLTFFEKCVIEKPSSESKNANCDNTETACEKSEPKFFKTDVAEFLKKLTFLVKQGNVPTVEEKIKMSISSRFDEYNEDKIRDNFLKSLNDFQTFWHQKGCLLSVDNDYFKKHSSVFILYKLKLRESEIEKYIISKNIKFTDSCLERLAGDIPKAGSVNIQTTPGAGILTVAKVLKILEMENETIIFVDSEYDKIEYVDEIECFFGFSQKINTLLHYVSGKLPSTQFIRRMESVVKTNGSKRLIVIGDEQIFMENSEAVKDKVTYLDLSAEAQQRVALANITFQSKIMCVKEVLGECEMLSDELLANVLLQEPIKIGYSPVENLNKLNYYPRKFNKHLVCSKILNKCKNDILLIQTSKIDCRDQFCKGRKIKFYPNSDPNRKNVYYILPKCSKYTVFHKLCEKQTNVHVLEFNNNKLRWLKSHGSMRLILENIEGQEVLTESEIVNCCKKEKLVVISGVAGMGKTTVLKSLANQVNEQYPELWILKINLSQHKKLLQDIKFSKQACSISETFLKSLTYSSVNEKIILTSMFAAGRVAVFIDGFDEISVAYEYIVIDFVKELQISNVQQIYLTTRPQEKEYSESNLHALSYTLVALDAEEQANFCSREWLRNEHKEQVKKELVYSLAQKLIAKIANISTEQDIAICGIPLQLRMIVEIYPTYVEGKYIVENNEQAITLESLYENFLTKKIHAYFMEKIGLPPSKLASKIQSKKEVDVLKEHQLIAIDMVFRGAKQDIMFSVEDQGKLEKVFEKAHVMTRFGIVSVVQPRNSIFTHQTLSEYLSAMYLCSTLEVQKSNEVTKMFVTNILIETKYQVLRKFLNGIVNKYNICRPLLNTDYLSKTNFICRGDSQELIHTPLHIAAKEDNINILIFLLKDLLPGSATAKQILNSYDEKYTVLQLFVKSSISWEYVDVIDLLVSLGADLNLRTRNGDSVLYLSGSNNVVLKKLLGIAAEQNKLQEIVQYDTLLGAVQSSNTECVELLISYGASVNWKDQKNKCLSLLHIASKTGSLETINYLVLKGAKINDKDCYKRSVLYVAVSRGRLNVVKFLLKHGVNIDDKNLTGRSVLQLAVSRNHIDIMNLLVKYGANVNDHDNDGRSVLYVAVSSRHLDIVKYLIEFGANVNDKDNNGRSVLQVAVSKGHLNIVKYLAEHGANVNGKDHYARSVLYVAVSNGHLNIVKYLVEHDANLNDRDNDGRSVLQVAVSKGHLKIVKLLEQHGANVSYKDTNGMSALHVAASKGHLHIVKYFIIHSANVNNKDNNGRSLLQVAANKGHLDIVQCLVEHGANVNDEDNISRSVLQVASSKGHLDIVKCLLKHGANVNHKDNFGRSVLYVSASKVRQDIVKCVLENSASVSNEDNNGRSVLQVAEGQGNLDKVKYFVKTGANINDKDYDSLSEPFLPVSRVHLDIVKYLIKFGANVNDKANDGRSVLQVAVRKNYLDIVKYLTKQGANVNDKDNNRRSVLQVAASKGHLDIVKYLTECSANINDKDNDGRSVLNLAVDDHDKDGRSALYVAVSSGHLDIIKYFLKFGANVNDKDNDGRSLLQVAASKGHLQIMKLLVKYGANVNDHDNDGRSALYVAVSIGYLDNVKYLLEFGANVNDKGNDGRSVLQVAISKGYLDIMKRLVKYGANVNDHDNVGRSALYVAVSSGHLDKIKYFLKFGAIVNDKDNDGRSLLQVAASKGHLDIMKLLVKYGAHVNDHDNDGRSVLYVAVSSGHLDIVKYLIELGANVNDKDNDGRSVLQVAASKGHLNIVKYLTEHGANVNDKDLDARSVLYIAVSNGHLNIVKYLAEHHANVNDKDNMGSSVLQEATIKNYQDIAKCLVEHGAHDSRYEQFTCSIL